MLSFIQIKIKSKYWRVPQLFDICLILDHKYGDKLGVSMGGETPHTADAKTQRQLPLTQGYAIYWAYSISVDHFFSGIEKMSKFCDVIHESPLLII